MRITLSILLCVLFVSCNVFDSSSDQTNMSVAEAKEKWSSNNIDSYTFDKRRNCYCFAPSSFSVKVVNGEITDVYFETEAQPHIEDREMAMQSTRTIDELFDLLEQYDGVADHFEIDYHDELGYPTKIDIDPSTNVADEEFILEISNVVSIDN